MILCTGRSAFTPMKSAPIQKRLCRVQSLPARKTESPKKNRSEALRTWYTGGCGNCWRIRRSWRSVKSDLTITGMWKPMTCRSPASGSRSVSPSNAGNRLSSIPVPPRRIRCGSLRICTDPAGRPPKSPGRKRSGLLLRRNTAPFPAKNGYGGTKRLPGRAAVWLQKESSTPMPIPWNRPAFIPGSVSSSVSAALSRMPIRKNSAK